MSPKNVLIYIGYILSFTSLALVIYIIRNTHTDYYEVDLYKNIPVYIWIILISIYIYAFFILFNKKHYSITLVALLILNSIILLIPRLKYNVLWDRWDSWYNVGHLRDILNTGYIDTFQDPYPGLHILEGIFIQISGLSIDNISNLVIPFLFSLYPIFMYILSKKLELDNIQKMSVIFFIILFPYIAVYKTATPLGFVTAIPFGYATFFIPLVMIFAFNGNSKPTLLTISILIFTITISHMITAIALAIGLLIMKIFARYSSSTRFSIDNNLVYISFMSIVSWLIYLTNIYAEPVRTVYNAIFFADVVATPYKDIMTNVGITGLDQVILILKVIIPSMILIFISLIAIIRIIKKDHGSIFVLLGWLVSNSVLFILITILISNLPFSSFRLLGILFILLPIIGGYEFGLEIKNNFNKTKFLIFSGILILFFLTGLFAKYPSPYTETFNFQSTVQEINGVQWLNTFKDKSILIAGSNYNRAILSGYIGWSEMYNRRDFGNMMLPIHLGYNETGYQNQSMIDKKYMLLTKFDFYWYSRRNELSNKDLSMIEDDKIFNKIYNNEEYKIFYSRN